MLDEDSIKNLSELRKFRIKFLNSKCKQENISSTFVPFFNALSEKNFSSQKELSMYVGCNKAHTNRILLKMECLGFISIKHFLNPENRTFYLTDKGKTVAGKICNYQNEFIEKLFDGIEKDELDYFGQILNKILLNASKNMEVN